MLNLDLSAERRCVGTLVLWVTFRLVDNAMLASLQLHPQSYVDQVSKDVHMNLAVVTCTLIFSHLYKL